MNFTVADIFMVSQKYLSKLLGGMSKIIDIFQTPIEDIIKINMSIATPGGIFGALGLQIVEWLDNGAYEYFNKFTLLDIMLEAGLGVFIAYTFIKWVVGIVTGS